MIMFKIWTFEFKIIFKIIWGYFIYTNMQNRKVKASIIKVRCIENEEIVMAMTMVKLIIVALIMTIIIIIW